MDGIGGEVKRMARSLVMSKRATIRGLDDFIAVVKPEKIKVIKNIE